MCSYFLQVSAQLDKNKKYLVSCIAFYNVENLYDTIDSPGVNDHEFTPNGPNQWNTLKYYKKLDRLAEVISQLGSEATPDGPAVIGLCEVENLNVLEDLVKTEKLKKNNYQIVHYDGPDHRGVDVALLYNPKYFKATNSKSYTLKINDDTTFKTRDQLVVSGIFDGEPMHFIVAHWPSRRGGQKASNPKRIEAGKLGRKIIDSLIALNANAKIAYMGDLNDDPVNASVKVHINTSAKIDKTTGNKLFNPMEELFKKGIGTLAWKDSWNLFDQIIITAPFVKQTYADWQFYKAKVFNKDFVKQDEGNFKGYPFRTFAGGQYTGGYSDHFAVYILLMKEKK
jgi:hypothetical protein